MSPASRAAVLRVTVEDLARARQIAGHPSTGISHIASILKLVDAVETAQVDIRQEELAARSDEPTGKLGPKR